MILPSLSLSIVLLITTIYLGKVLGGLEQFWTDTHRVQFEEGFGIPVADGPGDLA